MFLQTVLMLILHLCILLSFNLFFCGFYLCKGLIYFCKNNLQIHNFSFYDTFSPTPIQFTSPKTNGLKSP